MSRKPATSRFPSYRLLGALVGTAALLSMESRDARAEGSAQLGQISANGNNGLLANAEMFVDVLDGEDTLNIAARGQGNVDVSVAPVNPDGSFGAANNYTLTAGSGLLTGATVPATLPNGGDVPLRVTVTPGRYRVAFAENVEPFDLSVTTGAVSYNPGDVPANGGRLSAKDWRFFADLPEIGNETPMNANFFVRASVGEDYEYIWKLDFQGLLGGQMCLTANELGLPGEYARSSQPYTAITGIDGFDAGDRFSLCDEMSLYDIYVNIPNGRKPEPPAPVLESLGIGACGAVLEGSGGVFSFDADTAGTYLLVIDVNRDDVFDAKTGDIGINGLAQAGNNLVPWDGLDGDGQVLPAGTGYAARVFLRLGEFHFTGSDIEAVDPGVTVQRVAENATESATKLYWDDEALEGNGTFNNAELEPNPIWSTPNGVLTPHAWRGSQVSGTTYDGPGENSFIDTWVFGAEQFADVAFDILSESDDTDGDGLINGRECAIGSLVEDTDTDGDGVLDGQEEASSNLADPATDRDGDGIPDALDVDDDEDGIPTSLENPDPNDDEDAVDAQDSDGDGIPDYLDEDDDGDTVLTSEEGVNPSDIVDSQDSDDDGIPDYLDPDDDGDNVPTEEELPDENDDGVPDDAQNSDDDGTPDYLDPDDDGDGIPTEDETSDDNDNGTPDYLETPGPDTDGDGVPDDIECPNGSNCADTDGDGDDDVNDTDDDGDGILTVDEDLDDDGNPRNDDSDDDDIPNYLDTDDDEDGIPTLTEVTDGAEFGNDVDGTPGPNWLDTDSDGDGVGDGTEAAGDGDVNDNDVPDYLEPDVAPTDTDGDGIIDSVECPDVNACPDTDGDGDDDVNDTDDDGDGLLTENEAPAGNPANSDDDDLPDYLDPDDDDDGVFTRFENADPNEDGSPADAEDTNEDGTPDYLDPDDDGDGIATVDEQSDPNGDGDPADAVDTDEDGTPDYKQAAAPTADAGPGDATGDPGAGDAGGTSGDSDAGAGGGDRDGDGLTDAEECPPGAECPDFDNDGFPDVEDPDDDGDGVPTSTEDLDGDGDPRNDDTDRDGEPNYLDTDDDKDGILTKFEDINGNGNPADDNTDQDEFPNYLDTDDDNDTIPTNKERPDPNQDGNPEDARDTDDDGDPDYLDTDDDGDDITTVFEVGGNPDKPRDTDKDGKPDYLDAKDDRPDDELPDAATVAGGGFGCAVNGTTPSHHGPQGLALVAMVLGAGLFLRRRNRAAAAVVAGAASLGVAASAQAQETATGFAINRYNPSERGSDWFVGESLDLRGHGRLAAGLVFDWARKPLVSYDENGDEIAPIIANQLYGHVGLAVNLWERLRLAASLPVLFYQNGTAVEYGGVRYATREGAEVGDLRLGADLRLLGEYGDPATLAIGGQVTFPTGTRDAYTSDGFVRFLPRAALAGDLGIFAYSAQAGLDYRGLRVDYAEAPFGTDMRFAATLGLRLADKALLLGPELWGSTVISDSGEGLFEEEATPFEGIFGAHYFAGDWRFGAGVGPGFTRGLGAPALRVLASIEWFPAIEEAPPPPPPEPLAADTDGDGIRDDVDACVTVPGVASSDPAKHGCPERRDTDKDGIFDDEDACVTDAGVPSEDKEKHGCPPDQDGDGVLDRDDACVSEAGPKSDDPKKNGCPLPKDSDGDTIIDPEDACPDKAGPASDDPQKHGCPRAEVSGERVVILDRIEFDTGKATIRPESNAILEAVRAVLEENPQIKKVRVEGHTDNRGGRAMNVGLSRRRAASVVKWLVDNGISQERLTSQGLGPDKPVDSNDTDTGRQNNRRVEFHIVETSKPEAK